MQRLSPLVTLMALLLPCSLGAQQATAADSAVATAQVAARSWLTLVDHVRYGESWDSAATTFRNAVTKPVWEKAVLQARGPLEPFGTRKLLNAEFRRHLPNAPPGEYVVLQYETKVGGNRTVVETVTPMRESDGRWRVSGYFVRPQ
jgi:hypothetical protein